MELIRCYLYANMHVNRVRVSEPYYDKEGFFHDGMKQVFHFRDEALEEQIQDALYASFEYGKEQKYATRRFVW